MVIVLDGYLVKLSLVSHTLLWHLIHRSVYTIYTFARCRLRTKLTERNAQRWFGHCRVFNDEQLSAFELMSDTGTPRLWRSSYS